MRKLFPFCVVYLIGLCQVFGEPPTLHFIENKGQWPQEFRFKKSLGNGQVFFGKNKLQFHLTDLGRLSHPPHGNTEDHESEHNDLSGLVSHDSYSLTFMASLEPECIEGKGKRRTKVNYLKGRDPNDWFSNIATFESVLYGNVYDGIDAVFTQYDRYLKYDFYIAPNACPEHIRLRYDETEDLALKEGKLIVSTEIGYVQELKPYAYQIIEGVLVPVACNYILNGNEITFGFPEGYESQYALVIDPILIFSTYSGSTYDNWGNTATFDALGNLYSGGMVTTANGGSSFPITNNAYQNSFGGGDWDAAILKYDSAGRSLLYATYLGGLGNEIPQSLVVDQNGDLLILGVTSSSNFPVTNGSIFQGGTNIQPLGGVDFFSGTDIFISKLSADGSTLLASTYLGGSQNDGVNFISGRLNAASSSKQESPLARNYGDQLRGDIFTDSENNLYIASNSLSSDFLSSHTLNPFQGGVLDAVMVKLTTDFTVQWSRFIGGTGYDAAYSIKLNSVDEVVIAGGTTSSDLDITSGWQTTNAGGIDGWIQKFDSDGTPLSQGTYLGTANYDQSYFIDIDSEDNIFTFGQTQGVFPIVGDVYIETNGGQFLQKYSSDLSQLLLSTTFGSGGNSPDISPTAFLVNECNNIYFAGWGGRTNQAEIRIGNETFTRNFVGGNTFGLITSSDAIDPITSGSDFYLLVLSGDAKEFLYGTFFGGEQSATHVDGGTSRFDKNGIVYHAVCAGCGDFEEDFPATPGAFSETSNSDNCNNAAFKFDLASLRADFVTNSITFDDPGVSVICLGSLLVVENKSIGGELFEWDFGDGSPLVSRTDTSFLTHTYLSVGSYTIELRASDPNTCISEDFAFKTVQVIDPPFFLMEDVTICEGDQLTLIASGAANYQWVSEDSTFTSDLSAPMVSPDMSTRYFVRLDFASCSRLDTVDVTVIPQLIADFNTNTIELDNPGISLLCLGDSFVFENFSIEGIEFEWDFGDGSPTVTRADTLSVIHEYQSVGSYTVRLRAFDPNTCANEDFAFKIVQIVDPILFVMDDETICFGEELRLQANGALSYLWVSEDSTFSSGESSPLVQPEMDTRYFVLLNANSCPKIDTVDIRVIPEVLVDFTVEKQYDCWTMPQIVLTNLEPDQEAEFRWSLGDGTISQESRFTHRYETDGDYTITLSGQNEFCVFEKTLEANITTIKVPNVITPSSQGSNDTFIIQAPERVGLKIYNEWGRIVFEDDNYQNNWSAQGTAAGIYYYEAQIANEATCKGWVQVLK
ncbi:MAG: PKD domain-containing protein [Bacteroidota bacterium]